MGTEDVGYARLFWSIRTTTRSGFTKGVVIGRHRVMVDSQVDQFVVG